MKILMNLFTRRNQGTFHRTFPWAMLLASREHHVPILCTCFQKLLSSTTSTKHDVRIIETPALFHGERIMSRLSSTRDWGPLDIAARYRELRSGRYELVRTHQYHPQITMPAYLAGRKNRPALVTDWYDHYDHGGLRRYDHPINHASWPNKTGFYMIAENKLALPIQRISLEQLYSKLCGEPP